MTIEEWAATYALRFGVWQIQTSGYVEGEKEFLDMVVASCYQNKRPANTAERIDAAARICRALRKTGAFNDD